MEEAFPTLEDELVDKIWREDLAAVKRLLAAGADPSSGGSRGRSPIDCAAENDQTGDIIRVLVAAGIDVNMQTEAGWTPLHGAVDVAIDVAHQRGDVPIDWTTVGVLLELGANPNNPDKNGSTVFDLIDRYGSDAKQSFDDFMRARTNR